MSNIISCKNIIKSFSEDAPIIDDVSLELEEGCFASIMGRSGSGKTTLLRVICGLEPLDAGEVTVAGFIVNKLNEKEKSHFRSKIIGIVFQDSNLIDDFSVEENIFTPIYIAGEKPDLEYYKRLLEIAEISHLKDRYPRTLSGGQRQRVAVIRALIAKPKVLFADEPTGSLDSKSEQQIMHLFSTVNKEFGISILQVTHSEECAGVGSRIIRINDGKIE